MAIILTIWGLAAGAYGVMAFAVSKSAVHEIEAGIGFLSATVAIGCAGIIDAVKRKQAPESIHAPSDYSQWKPSQSGYWESGEVVKDQGKKYPTVYRTPES